MGQAEPQKNHYTFEEYLELEKYSSERHEYYYGEVYAMAGTSKRHYNIQFNLVSFLRNELKGRNCSVYGESIKIEIKKKFHYVYPDVVVSCHEAENDPLYIKYPQLIIEILSDSTESYDRYEKFDAYKKIPTLEYYILVNQKRCAVECFSRKGEAWIQKIYFTQTDVLEIESLNLLIPLDEVYNGITFDTDLKVLIEQME